MKKRSGFNVMSRLIGLVKPLAGFMVLAVLMGLLGHLCATFLTVFGVNAVLNILGLETGMTLAVIFGCMVLFSVARAFLRYGEQGCNHYIAFRLLALIRDKIFKALRRLCPAKLEGRDKGDLISLITSDIELLEVFYAHTISPALIGFFFSVILCLYIGSFHVYLGLLALAAYLVVGLFVPMFISRMSGDKGLQFRTKSGALSAYVLDSIRGLQEIIQYNQGAQRLAKMNERTADLTLEEAALKKTTGRNLAITNAIILVFDLSMAFLSIHLYSLGELSFSGVLLATVALMSSFGPVIALANLGSTLQSTFAAGNRVLDILDEVPQTEEITGKPEITFSGADVEHVTFSYGNEVVLKDLTLEVPENQIVGIIGKSGSGKSTLLKLFMRFWEAQEGKVRISGTPVSQVNTTNLRDMESFVTQTTHLFCDSIRNNLKIAKLDATDEELEAACKKASVHDFIMSLPQGYDTPVGELGDTLSGGEQQRLGLARAFLHGGDFMLLDEPTSNLDSLNEAVILKSLGEESRGKTVVLVSHRESTMKIADKVYSVENGRMS